jgi:hypothetical protein
VLTVLLEPLEVSRVLGLVVVVVVVVVGVVTSFLTVPPQLTALQKVLQVVQRGRFQVRLLLQMAERAELLVVPVDSVLQMAWLHLPNREPLDKSF